MTQGKFVLENKLGQVVRTFRWEHPTLALVYRRDTHRVEACATVEPLKASGVPFDLLAEVSQKDISTKPIKIADIGTFKWIPDVKITAPSVQVPDEDPRNYWFILKWSALAHVGFLIVVLTLGHFLTPRQKAQEPVHEVTVYRQEQIMKQILVNPAESKEQLRAMPQHIVRSHAAQRVPRYARNLLTHSGRVLHRHGRGHGFDGPRWGRGLGNMGALGVLGNSRRHSTGRGGFNIANARSTGGFGSGRGGGGLGGSGAGGIPRAIFSRGLIAANPGYGSGAPGAGGYGTRGHGGGGRTGYGHLSMIGASQAYLEPAADTEELVEGGLDRDQINDVIQRHMGQIVYCYEQGLQIHPELTGRVSVRFIIGGHGAVNTAQVAHSSLRDRQVEGCILARLRNWKFPKPLGHVSVRVTYPFALRRVSQN